MSDFKKINLIITSALITLGLTFANYAALANISDNASFHKAQIIVNLKQKIGKNIDKASKSNVYNYNNQRIKSKSALAKVNLDQNKIRTLPVKVVKPISAPKELSKNLKKITNIKQTSFKLSFKSVKLLKTHQNAALVYMNNKIIAEYIQTTGKFTPEIKAKILISKLHEFIAKKGNAAKIVPGIENGLAVARVGDQVLFTVDNKVADAQKTTAFKLSYQWINNIRSAFGVHGIVRNTSLIASRGISPAFSRQNIFSGERTLIHQFGFASWYGKRFHGKRTADGSVFNMYNFTAAHKTLPLGSYVRVTNMKNGKTCIVKITDRGPFVRGRVIDLSSAAASELGMLSSGISRVKLEILN